MKKNFKTLLIDGILFLLPVILILFLFKFIFNFILEIITPIIKILPKDSIPIFEMPNLIGVIILFLLIILCGYLSRSSIGTWFLNLMDGLLAKIIPGFSIIKELFYGQKDIYEDKKIKPALALIDDAWLFAFILEEKNDAGFLAVFVPSAPVPTSGNVYLMIEEQLKRLDISVKDAVSCITQLGMGSSKILEGKIK